MIRGHIKDLIDKTENFSLPASPMGHNKQKLKPLKFLSKIDSLCEGSVQFEDQTDPMHKTSFTSPFSKRQTSIDIDMVPTRRSQYKLAN